MKAIQTIAMLLAASEGRLKFAQEEFDAIKGLQAEIEADLQASHDAGFDEGLKQVSAPGDKQFSLEELDAEVAAKTAPLKEQIGDLTVDLEAKQSEIDALNAKVSEMENQPKPVPAEPVDVEAIKAAAKEEGKAELKAELLAKYEEQQVAETEKETGFKDLLK